MSLGKARARLRRALGALRFGRAPTDYLAEWRAFRALEHRDPAMARFRALERDTVVRERSKLAPFRPYKEAIRARPLRVLDVGCGLDPSDVAFRWGASGFDWPADRFLGPVHVIGVEENPAIAALARARFRKKRDPVERSPFTVLVKPFLEARIRPASVDVTTMLGFTLGNQEKPLATLKKMMRVTRPGGKVIFSVYAATPKAQQARLAFYQKLPARYEVIDRHGTVRFTFEDGSQVLSKPYTRAALKALLRKAGARRYRILEEGVGFVVVIDV